MSRSDSQRCGPPKEAGYILPITLLGVFVLAVTANMALEALRPPVRLVSLAQQQSDLERALLSAQAHALFDVLTGLPVQGGVMTGLDVSSMDFFDEPDIEGSATGNAFWSASGGIRRYGLSAEGAFERVTQEAAADDAAPDPFNTIEIQIAYRDASGLFPLNTPAGDEQIETLVSLLAINGDTQSLAARLGDYTDADNIRRFRGAERADYRLRGLQPPSNNPLRVHEELGTVMDWADVLTREAMVQIRRVTTLMPVVAVSETFAVDLIASEPALMGDKDGLFGVSDRPGERFRLVMEASDGTLSVQRTVDVEFVANGIHPYIIWPVEQRSHLLSGETPQ